MILFHIYIYKKINALIKTEDRKFLFLLFEWVEGGGVDENQTCFVQVYSWCMNERYVREAIWGLSQWEEGKCALLAGRSQSESREDDIFCLFRCRLINFPPQRRSWRIRIVFPHQLHNSPTDTPTWPMLTLSLGRGGMNPVSFRRGDTR